MKTKNLLFSVVSLALVGSAALFFSGLMVENTSSYQPRNMKSGFDIGSYDKGYHASAAWWFNNRKDPNTGELNIPAMIKAMNDANAVSGSQNRMAALGLQWNEQGPNNFGGRVRAFLIDRTNPNKLFAGGVSGGLWRSTNGGTSWTIYKDTMVNMNVTSICQASNGDIYFGTGEGLYYFFGTGTGGFLGAGVWKSTDGGNTFNRIVSTSVPNSTAVDWYGVNDLAASPTDPNRIYAATERGFLISNDGGQTWTDGIATPINQRTTDVVVNSNGAVAVSYGGKLYISPNGDIGSYTSVSTGAAGMLPTTTMGRIVPAYAPSDPNYLYACLVKSNQFLHAVYVSKDGGASWNLIGNGGSNLFNPFGSNGQGIYDCCLTVYPNNKNKVMLGGVTLWTYTEAQSTPVPSGQWQRIDSGFDSPFNPYYVHSDKHRIRFHPNNPNTVYIATDGGIFRSLDGGVTFSPMNHDLNIAQMYGVGFSKTGNEYIGGTQDNGTLYVDHTGNTWLSGVRVMGGDGSFGEISMVNPDAQFAGSYYGVVSRSPNNGDSYGDFYNARVSSSANFLNPGFASFVTPFALYETLNEPNPIDSVTFSNDSLSFVIGSAPGNVAQFTSSLPFPQASASIQPGSVKIKAGAQVVTDNGSGQLIGSVNGAGVNTIDYNTGAFNVTFATNPPLNTVITSEYNVVYTAGDVLLLNSNSANFPFNYTLTAPLNPGQSIKVPDRIVSKLAVGFTSALYMIRRPLDFSVTPEWIKIGGGNSRNEQGGLSSMSGEIQSMEWAPNGDHIYVGTANGHVYRISHLNSIKDSASNGDVDSLNAGNTDAIPRCTRLAHFNGRAITGLGVDPSNGNRLIVTLGGYGVNGYVYVCDSAQNAVISVPINNTTKFAIRQGNLPQMPVYDGLFDMTNGANVIIATEYGTWTTNNINTASPVWTKEIDGMSNVPSIMIRQQRHRNWVVTNTGQVWVATHGRGMFMTNTLAAPLGAPENSPWNSNSSVFKSSVKVFPNPLTNNGNVSFFMPFNGPAAIEVYSLSGKLMMRMDLGKLSTGSYTRDFDVSEFAAGTYFISIVAGEQKAVAKFVKLAN
jgi:photosystem II stability/assembly factor-like uncharacterized protein